MSTPHEEPGTTLDSERLAGSLFNATKVHMHHASSARELCGVSMRDPRASARKLSVRKGLGVQLPFEGGGGGGAALPKLPTRPPNRVLRSRNSMSNIGVKARGVLQFQAREELEAAEAALMGLERARRIKNTRKLLVTLVRCSGCDKGDEDAARLDPRREGSSSSSSSSSSGSGSGSGSGSNMNSNSNSTDTKGSNGSNGSPAIAGGTPQRENSEYLRVKLAWESHIMEDDDDDQEALVNRAFSEKVAEDVARSAGFIPCCPRSNFATRCYGRRGCSNGGGINAGGGSGAASSGAPRVGGPQPPPQQPSRPGGRKREIQPSSSTPNFRTLAHVALAHPSCTHPTQIQCPSSHCAEKRVTRPKHVRLSFAPPHLR